MKVVNKSNLPEVIFQYLAKDNYDFVPDEKSISATGLLKSTRETILTNRHSNEIEIDAADRLWSLFGSGIHAVLEKGNLSDQQEERLNIEFEGYKISGKFDIIHENCLKDFKCTSAWTLVYKDRLKEWNLQLSIYRWLYWKAKGIEIANKGYIVAILRDWNARDMERVNNYPNSPIKQLEFDLMPFDEVEKFIRCKLDVLKAEYTRADDLLIPCTKEETWKGKKCEKYCDVAKFCNCRVIPEVKVKKTKEAK